MPNAHTNALLDQLVDDTVSVMTIISTEPPTTTDPESQQEDNKAAEAPETSQTITNNEVSAQDDDDETNHTLLLSIFGRVYDVSAGRKFYGRTARYHMFPGHDVTYALSTGCKQHDCLSKTA